MTSYGAEDIPECNRRQERMEALYEYDGRSNPDHRHHAVYSGLAALYPHVSLKQIEESMVLAAAYYPPKEPAWKLIDGEFVNS